MSRKVINEHYLIVVEDVSFPSNTDSIPYPTEVRICIGNAKTCHLISHGEVDYFVNKVVKSILKAGEFAKQRITDGNKLTLDALEARRSDAT